MFEELQCPLGSHRSSMFDIRGRLLRCLRKSKRFATLWRVTSLPVSYNLSSARYCFYLATRNCTNIYLQGLYALGKKTGVSEFVTRAILTYLKCLGKQRFVISHLNSV